MTYQPAVGTSITARLYSAAFGVLARGWLVRKDTRRRSAEEIARDSLAETLGTPSEIDMVTRNSFLGAAYMVTGLAGVLVTFAGVVAASLVRWLVDDQSGFTAVLWAALPVGAPLMAIGGVWAFRSLANEWDMRRWRAAGEPAVWAPPGVSQPKDRDFLYALPICALIIATFVG